MRTHCGAHAYFFPFKFQTVEHQFSVTHWIACSVFNVDVILLKCVKRGSNEIHSMLDLKFEH